MPYPVDKLKRYIYDLPCDIQITVLAEITHNYTPGFSSCSVAVSDYLICLSWSLGVNDQSRLLKFRPEKCRKVAFDFEFEWPKNKTSCFLRIETITAQEKQTSRAKISDLYGSFSHWFSDPTLI